MEKVLAYSSVFHLVVGEDAGDDDHSCQDNAEVQVVIRWLLHRRGLDEVGHEAEDGPQPQEHRKPT